MIQYIWGDTMSKKSKEALKALKKRLTNIQFHVTQEEGTEPPFQNAFWDHEEEGIYVDVVSNEVLFSSINKYDAGCGWPSFTKPISKVKTHVDRRYGMERIEVRSEQADSHLGHVFDDGPEETGGLRYCINSAALKFVPVSKMKEEGYENYLKLFEKTD